MKRYAFVLLYLFILISIPMSAFAAINQFGTEDISAELSPENPAPYENVTITLVSFGANLNKAAITWKNGSAVLASGTGLTSYTYTAPAANASVTLSAFITPAEQTGTIQKQIVISPSDVDILFEAVDSYTPPFYRGKALPTQEGLIRVVAYPNTGGVPGGKSDMVYTWKLEHNTSQSASGFGKDSFTFQNSYLRSAEHVDVAVSSVSNGDLGTTSIVVPIGNPKMLFYNSDPTEGIKYENAITNDTSMSGEEMTLLAEPYFLSLKNNEEDFNYSWKINGESVATPKNPRQLTIRPTSRGGYATISLSLTSISKLFQALSQSIKINL